MEIFILNDKFEVLAEIDSYTSLIWCRRAHSIGALDLEIEASTENVKRFQIGYFIYRKDTNDICRIDSIEVKTDAENGDSLIIGAVDLKSLAEQVTVLGEYKTEITNDGESTIIVKNEVNVEEWIREAMKVFTSNDSTVLPKSVYPQFQIDNFSLYNLKGYETKQVLLEEKDAKLSEHINYLCKMSGMSWEITYDYDTGLLNLNVVKGLDKTINQEDNTRVLFSKTFDNLQSTKIAQSIGKMANVAVVHHNNASIVGDNGVVFAYLTREEPYGIYRFDISVDGTNVEIPHIQTDADFVEVPEGTGVYKKNDDGTFTKGKGNYDYHPQYTVDEIKSYREILKGLGLAKLRENRVSQNFESEINFNQFVYREDYDVGDVVTVQNDYGIQLDAKIIEVVETWDETGYSIEPAFEFIGAGGNFGGFGGFGNFENTENDWDLTDCLITEDNEPMMTETENFYLMYEAAITTLATEYGIALTSENDALIMPVSNGLEPTAQVASMATYGAEAVAATTYDVSATSVDIETVKISELPEAEGIGDACCLPIVQEGETKKIYFDSIKDNIYENLEIDKIKDELDRLASPTFSKTFQILNHYGDTTTRYFLIAQTLSKSNHGNMSNIYINGGDFRNNLYEGTIRTRDPMNIINYGSADLPIEFYEQSDGTINIYWKDSNTYNSITATIHYTNNVTVYDGKLSSISPTGTKISPTIQNRKRAYDSDKANYRATTMVQLGFTAGSNVSVKDFWSALANNYGSNGVIHFVWSGSHAAYLGDSSNRFNIEDGTLIYTTNGNGNSTWTTFSATYYGVSGKVYSIGCSIGSDVANATWSINNLTDKADSSHSHSDKANYRATTMVGLGFTAGSNVSVKDFWSALANNYGSNGVIQFVWSGANAAYLGDSSSCCNIDSGTLIYTTGGAPAAWRHFSAIYIQGAGNNNIFSINCLLGSDTTDGKENWSIKRLADVSQLSSAGMYATSNNTMASGSSIDFNTNKATIQIPIFSADATDQPTAQGAMWLQEVKESE